MTAIEPINLLETPLDPGTHLIEASAGTGKTQTIAGLFLRLLLETHVEGQPLQVDQILVLTFTEAATEELRDRIRSRLVQAQRIFQNHPKLDPTTDPFLAGLVDRHASERQTMVERLRLALTCFDLAPIFTIHGFCQRALKDRAFESGSLFDEELLPDQSALLEEIADDFWRRHFYSADPLLLAITAQHGLSSRRLLPLLQSGLRHPRLRLASRTDDKPEVIAQRLRKNFEQAQRSWKTEREHLHGCFGSRRAWGKQPYNNDSRMAPLLASLDRLFSQTEIFPRDLVALGKFSSSEITANISRRYRVNPDRPPSHPFFDYCEQICRDTADFVVAVQKLFLETARPALRARKQEQKLLSYDDLLLRLHDALRGPGGPALGIELRRRFKAALIDEFQDTDPIQAEIFAQIFLPKGLAPSEQSSARRPARDTLRMAKEPGLAAGSRLFLIGDPKQAIYGFRGADIFSYLAVARKATQRFTLGENWRSASGLVTAVNTLFARSPRPFVFPEILFEPVIPRGQADLEPLRLPGESSAPLQIWFCPRADEREIARTTVTELLCQSVAGEIARLLGGNHRIGSRALRPQDFAVLVMTHDQAQHIQDALHHLGLPAVQQTQESVFGTDEAEEFLRILTAIAHPSDEPAVRAALATRLGGISGQELHRLQTDEPAWQTYLEQHRRWFEEWSLRGFASMFRQWAIECRLRPRLLGGSRGERCLTNTLHLAELLHQTAATEKLGPAALTKWLACRVGRDAFAAEEYQLRLERDENAVQIVTVHKSKGLQYEIVFAPFCWRESQPIRGPRSHDDTEVLFHDWTSGELIRDLGPDIAEEHKQQAAAERLAENVRLLYVALTRARHRCYLAWGAIKDAGTSAPAWLFHRARGQFNSASFAPATAPGPAPVWSLDFAGVSDDELRDDLQAFARASLDSTGAPAIAVTDRPAATTELAATSAESAPALECHRFTGIIEQDWRVASFSWMASGRRLESPDHDTDEIAANLTAETATGIFAFPRGTNAGTCLHKIFETIELREPESSRTEAQVRRQLTAHGIDAEHHAAVLTAVRHTLAAPIGDETASFKLSDIHKPARLTELEFCFALNPIEPAVLRRLFSEFSLPSWAGRWPEQIGQLTFSPTRGYMKGYIDLVCESNGRYHLIDWKSNWLGSRLADYHAKAIRREMINRFYILQYHLYAVALHRHLQLRLPGYRYHEHFGGIHYMFIRGIDNSLPQHGIFSDTPREEHIVKLSQTLLSSREP